MVRLQMQPQRRYRLAARHLEATRRHWLLGSAQARWAGCAIVSLSGLACQRNDFEKDPAPDLAPLAAAYESPTGTVTVETVAEALAGLAAQADAAELDLDGLLEELLMNGLETEATSAPAPGVEPQAQPTRRTQQEVAGVEGEGMATIRHICRGWTLPSVPDIEQNGSLRVVIGFTEDSVDSVAWASVDQCRMLDETERRVELVQGARSTGFGDVHLYLGPNPGFDLTNVTAPILQFDFSVSIDDQALHLAGSYRRVRATNTLEVLTETSTGPLVAFVSADALGVRGANGVFVCDASTETCSNGSGESVSYSPP